MAEPIGCHSNRRAGPSAPYFKRCPPRNCSTFGYERRFSGSNPYAHLMLIGSIRPCLRRCTSGKLGVMEVDLASREAVEVVGEISDREVGRAGHPVARNSARLGREWARLRAKN